MAYTVTYGGTKSTPAQRCETATVALELVKKLQAENRPNIKITDRSGTVRTVADLERLSGKENI